MREIGNGVTEIDLDFAVTMEAGKSYRLIVRRPDEAPQAVRVSGAAGSAWTVRTTESSDSAVGDLVSFGELKRETLPCLVSSIEPQANLEAILTLIPYSEDVYDAVNHIPAYQPNLSIPVTPSWIGPAAPTIDDIVSDERALTKDSRGVYIPSIIVYFSLDGGDPLDGRKSIAQNIEVRWKKKKNDRWQSDTISARDGSYRINGVELREVYDIQIRVVDSENGTSSWIERSHEVSGNLNPPGPVDSLHMNSLGDSAWLSWIWGSPEIDAVGFEIRYSQDQNETRWERMIVIATDISIDTRQFQIPGVNGTYAIKTIDSGGRKSSVAKFINATLSTPRTTNVIELMDDFTGTLVNMEVSNDRLIMERKSGSENMSEWPNLNLLGNMSTALEYHEEGSLTKGWFDLGATHNSRLTVKAIASGQSRIGDSISKWGALSNLERMTSVLNTDVVNIIPEFRHAKTRNANGVYTDASDWIRLTVADVSARHIQFRLRVETEDLNITPIISDLEFEIDMEDKSVVVEDAEIPGKGGYYFLNNLGFKSIKFAKAENNNLYFTYAVPPGGDVHVPAIWDTTIGSKITRMDSPTGY